MSAAPGTVSPRPPRAKHKPPQSPATLRNNSSSNNVSSVPRRPKGARARSGHHPNHTSGASPSRQASETGVIASEDEALRNSKKHAYPQFAIQSSLTDTEATTGDAGSTPIKVESAYAGPTFHASPAPSALPIPKFLSRSVPAPSAPKSQTPPPEDSSDSADSPRSVQASPSRAPIAVPQHHLESPLNMLFNADRAERAKNVNSPGSVQQFSPSNMVRPLHHKHDSYGSLNAVFPIEIDGQNKIPQASPPLALSRVASDPCKVPQLKDNFPPGNGNDVVQDLFQRLSMSQKKHQGTTPPQLPGPGSTDQSLEQTPPPFRSSPGSVRSVSGPSTPAPSNQRAPDFHYGNRNLSPLFKAAQGETSRPNSGLRTELSADSPVVSQGQFQDFPSIPSPQTVDPNSFSRGPPPSTPSQPHHARNGSAPYGQQYPSGPSDRRRTPGRQPHQPRPDSYPSTGAHRNISSPKTGQRNGNKISTTKPMTSMMSFVPASVSAKPRPGKAPPTTSPPPAATASQPDPQAMGQDLKPFLNLR